VSIIEELGFIWFGVALGCCFGVLRFSGSRETVEAKAESTCSCNRRGSSCGHLGGHCRPLIGTGPSGSCFSVDPKRRANQPRDRFELHPIFDHPFCRFQSEHY